MIAKFCKWYLNRSGYLNAVFHNGFMDGRWQLLCEQEEEE